MQDMPPVIKPVVKSDEKPDGFDDFFNSPGLNRKRENEDKSVPSWWTDLMDTVAHVQAQVLELSQQRVDASATAKIAAEAAVEMVTARYKDNAAEVARMAAIEAARKTAETLKSELNQEPKVTERDIGTPQDEKKAERPTQEPIGAVPPVIHVTVNNLAPTPQIEVHQNEKEKRGSRRICMRRPRFRDDRKSWL